MEYPFYPLYPHFRQRHETAYGESGVGKSWLGKYHSMTQRRQVFHGGNLSVPLITQPDKYETHSPRAIGVIRQPRWRSWVGWPTRPYEVDLSKKQGVIFGATEQSITTSLYRLAFNAAVGGWKVFLFDALGNAGDAATFAAVMQEGGHERIHIFPNDPYAGFLGTGQAILHRLLQVSPFREPYYQHIAIAALASVLSDDAPPIEDLDGVAGRLACLLQKQKERQGLHKGPLLSTLLGSLRPTDLVGTPLRYHALSTLIGESLNGGWSYADADAAYFSLSAWSRPEEARLQARFLLADLASFLTERAPHKARVLLLLKHPELLFDPQELAPLFARMEQAGGSLFIAARSTADFGKAAPHLLQNASLLLVHRSPTTLPFEPYLALPWWKPNPLTDGTLQQLEDRDCFAISEGTITPVRIMPAPINYASVVYATSSLSSRTRPTYVEREAEQDPFSMPDLDDENEIERLVTSIFGNGASQEEEVNQQPISEQERPPTAPSRSKQRRTRSRRAFPSKGADLEKEADQMASVNTTSVTPPPEKKSRKVPIIL